MYCVVAEIIDDTESAAGKSDGQFSGNKEEDDDSCNTYHETICSKSDQATSSDQETCQQFPVRLCAHGCRIQEGPITCRDVQVSTKREVPTEECHLVPQRTCR